MWFLGLMSVFGVVALVGFVLFMAFLWYRQHSAPGPGIVLGAYTIFGRYAGQKVHSELKGVMVDSTGFFCSSDMTSAFRELLRSDVGHMLQDMQPEEQPAASQPANQAASPQSASSPGSDSQVTSQVEKTPLDKVNPLQSPEQAMLQNVKSQLDSYPLEQICRVNIIRDGIFGQRHILVSFHDPKRSLSDFASNEEKTHFTLGYGPVNKGVIFGAFQTFIDAWEFPNERFALGKFPAGTVHIIVPEEPLTTKTEEQRKEEAKNAKERLDVAKLVLNIPNIVHILDYVQSLKHQIKDKDIALRDMGEDLSAATAERDYYKRIIVGFSTEPGEEPKITAPKKMDILDGLVLFLFPTVFYGVAQAFGVYPLIGVVAGLAASLYVIYRRR